MKKLALLLALLLIPTLFYGVGMAASGWQVYQLEDGSICVTDESLDEEVITSLELGVGETRYIEVQNTSEYKFVSSSMYVKVDKYGMLLCEGTGRATLRIYYTSASYVEIRVEVSKAPGSVKFSKDTVYIDPGQQSKLGYSLPRNTAGWVDFYSSNEDVVEVNNKGEIFAVAPGRAQVYAETYNDKTAECTVIVNTPSPAKLTVDSELTGYCYESFHINASLEGGYRETLSFESLNPDICEVDSKGNVSCLKEGIAMIDVRSSGGKKVSCIVTVLPCAQSIAPESDVIYVYQGGKAEVRAVTSGGSGAYSLESLDKSIAVTDTDGELLAVGTGSCPIRITAPGGAYADATLVVLPFPEECTLKVERTSMAVGETIRCGVASAYTASMPISLSVSDPGILSVDANGSVRALVPGKAKVIAKGGGLTQEVEIEVEAMSRSISFERDEYMAGVGDTLSFKLIYSSGAGLPEYGTTNASVASVDDEGHVTAVAPGDAVIYARLLNGTEARSRITVYEAATTVKPNIERAVIGVGDFVQVDFSFDEGRYSNIIWHVDDASLISHDGEGGIRSIGGTGSARVVASIITGAEAAIAVNVIDAPSDMTLDAERLSQNSLFTDYVAMSVDEVRPLNPRFPGYTSVSFTVESLDPDIVSADASGVLTALNEGTAQIRISCYNGYTRTVLVEVS